MLNHPSKAKRNRAAFVSDDSSFLAESGKTHPDAGRSEIAPGVETANKKRGRSRRPNNGDGRQPKKASMSQNPVNPGRGKCLACGMPHDTSTCFYMDSENAPEWWRPNQQIEELVRYKREHDPDLQRVLRQSSSRSKTPHFKKSHTATPEVTEEQ